MKLTQNKKLKPGMTLIELTVVIIVLLTLISVLFFAGTAYIKASNRTSCLTTQAQIQKSIRAYQNLNNLKESTPPWFSGLAVVGDTLTFSKIENAGLVSPGITCPTDSKSYATLSYYPYNGTKAVSCTDLVYGVVTDPSTGLPASPDTATGAVLAAAGDLHTPKSVIGW